MRKWIALMALATAASGALATSLYEPFNYPVGSNLDGLVAPNGQPWATAGPAGMFSGTIGSGNLSYSGLPAPQGNELQWGSPTSDAERLDIGGYNNGTVFWSMEFEVTNIAGMAPATFNTGGLVAGFNNSIGAQSGVPSVVGATLVVRQSTPANAGDYNFGIVNNGGTVAYDTADNLSVGTTYFVVGEYDFVDPAHSTAGQTNDIVKLWVNPSPAGFDSSTVPAATITTTGNDLTNSPGNSIASFFLRQYNEDPDGTGAMIADELRVATSWAGVTAAEWTAASPGPSTWGSGGSWSTGAVPGGQGADVTFGANATSYNVSLDSPQTVGTIRFNGANNYTIAGSSLLTFDAPVNGSLNIGTSTSAAYVASAASAAQIVVSGTASHTISTPVYFNRSTAMTVPAGSTLTLSGGVSANTTPVATGIPGVWLSLSGGGNVVIQPSSSTAFAGLTGLDISGKLTFSAAHSLILLNTGTATVSSHPNTVTLFNLASGSTLDLTNNDLIVNRNGGDGVTETAILNAVEHAYDFGAWDQTGITSSAAAAKRGTTLAYIDNALLTTRLSTVDGQPVTNLSTIVKYTWYGDLNLDGVVNNTDLQAMGVLNSTKPLLPGWASGDLNYDGVINADDYALFQLGAAMSGGAPISSVPEPALGILGLVILAARCRGRKG